MKGQFTIKYLIFREIWKIPCILQIFHVVPKFPVFSLSGKIDQISCFPCGCAVATLMCDVDTCTSDAWMNTQDIYEPKVPIYIPCSRRTSKILKVKCNPTNKTKSWLHFTRQPSLCLFDASWPRYSTTIMGCFTGSLTGSHFEAVYSSIQK